MIVEQKRASWVEHAVEPTQRHLAEFTVLAADLAAGVKSGSIELTEYDTRALGLALQGFEAPAGRLRTQLHVPGPGPR